MLVVATGPGAGAGAAGVADAAITTGLATAVAATIGSPCCCCTTAPPSVPPSAMPLGMTGIVSRFVTACSFTSTTSPSGSIRVFSCFFAQQ